MIARGQLRLPQPPDRCRRPWPPPRAGSPTPPSSAITTASTWCDPTVPRTTKPSPRSTEKLSAPTSPMTASWPSSTGPPTTPTTSTSPTPTAPAPASSPNVSRASASGNILRGRQTASSWRPPLPLASPPRTVLRRCSRSASSTSTPKPFGSSSSILPSRSKRGFPGGRRTGASSSSSAGEAGTTAPPKKALTPRPPCSPLMSTAPG